MRISHSIAQLHDKDNPVVPWSRSTTYNFIKEGRLHPRYIGTKPIIDHTDVEQCIESLPTKSSKEEV